MAEQKLVHLTSIYDIMEANLLKSKLESEGITCLIFDENTVGVNPLYSTAVGGVRIMVSDTDADEALVILETFKPGAAGIILCPNCSSKDLSVKQKPWNYILSLFYLIFGITQSAALKPKYTCKDCGNSWK